MVQLRSRRANFSWVGLPDALMSKTRPAPTISPPHAPGAQPRQRGVDGAEDVLAAVC